MHEFAERSEIGRGMKLPELTQSSRSAIVVATIVASGLLLLGLLTAPALEAQDNRSNQDSARASSRAIKTLAVDTAKLSCLTPALIQQIKSDLPNIADAYNECRAEITERTKDMQLDDLGHRVVFATIATNASAPFGSFSAYKLPDLLAAPSLTSDNYLLLLGNYLDALHVTPKRSQMRMLGFDGGATGNYAQGMITISGTSLLLDPTIGMVVKIGFDDLLSSRRAAARNFVIAYMHDDPGITAVMKRISNSVYNGLYKPSDLLYYFFSPEYFMAFNGIIPAGQLKNVHPPLLRFPTPGATSLARTQAQNQQAAPKPAATEN